MVYASRWRNVCLCREKGDEDQYSIGWLNILWICDERIRMKLVLKCKVHYWEEKAFNDELDSVSSRRQFSSRDCPDRISYEMSCRGFRRIDINYLFRMGDGICLSVFCLCSGTWRISLSSDQQSLSFLVWSLCLSLWVSGVSYVFIIATKAMEKVNESTCQTLIFIRCSKSIHNHCNPI
jgi:hypothetical protein